MDLIASMQQPEDHLEPTRFFEAQQVGGLGQRVSELEMTSAHRLALAGDDDQYWQAIDAIEIRWPAPSNDFRMTWVEQAWCSRCKKHVEHYAYRCHCVTMVVDAQSTVVGEPGKGTSECDDDEDGSHSPDMASAASRASDSMSESDDASVTSLGRCFQALLGQPLRTETPNCDTCGNSDNIVPDRSLIQMPRICWVRIDR